MTKENWKYRIDPETGLRILVSKKDPKAIERIRKRMDKFFKIEEDQKK